MDKFSDTQLKALHERELKRAKVLRRHGVKVPRVKPLARPKLPHFRTKATRHRLTPTTVRVRRYVSFCVGGEVIATWPDNSVLQAAFSTKEHLTILHLKLRVLNQGTAPATTTMILRLRMALLKAEEGKRAKGAKKQRERLNQYLGIPKFITSPILSPKALQCAAMPCPPVPEQTYHIRANKRRDIRHIGYPIPEWLRDQK